MRRASLLVLFLTIFIDLLGFGIVIPLLPYYARHYGASGRVVGMVVAVYSLMQFFFAPLWGRLSDRIGRRPVLLVSLSGSFCGYVLFALSESLPMLFVARLVAGVAAANIGTAQAYIADSTSPENRARGMGIIGAAFGLGFILGPPAGGILSSLGTRAGYHGNFLPGLVSAALSLVAFLVATFALAESKPPTNATVGTGRARFDRGVWREMLQSPALRTVYATLFLIILAFAGMETTVALFARDRYGLTARDLGYFFGFMGVIVASIQGGLIGKLTRRFGERRLVSAGAVSLCAGMLAVPSIADPRYLYAAAFFIAVGQGLCYPSLTSLVTKFAVAEKHGSALGISSSVGSLSRIAGPLYAGVFYDAIGAPGPFYAGGALVLVALVLSLSLRGTPQ